MQIRMLKTKDLQAHFSPKYQSLDGLFSPPGCGIAATSLAFSKQVQAAEG
jgi:hypothetical protein